MLFMEMKNWALFLAWLMVYTDKLEIFNSLRVDRRIVP